MTRNEIETKINLIVAELDGVRAQLNCISAGVINEELPPTGDEVGTALMGLSYFLDRILQDLIGISSAVVRPIKEDEEVC